MRFSPFLLWLLAVHGLAAEPSVTVQKVVGRASAPLHSVLTPGTSFTTGTKSKSELSLPQGVARVGAQSSVETTAGGLVLRRGITLVASEPGTSRKTIEVRAPGYRLRVKGTVQVAFDPGRSLKLVVLEGTATVSLDSLMGEFESLRPGQMLVINPGDRRLPEPVEVDVQRLAATSALASGELGTLSTAGEIKAATGKQAVGYARGDLQETPVLLRGLSNNIEIEERRLAVLPAAARASSPEESERGVFNVVDDLQNPAAITKQQTFQFPDKRNVAETVTDTTFIRDPRHTSRTHVLEVELLPLFDYTDPDRPVALREPQLSGNISINPNFFASDPKTLLFTTRTGEPNHQFDRLHVLSGANIHTPAGINLGFQAVLGMDVDSATLTAGAAQTERLELQTLSRGLTIKDSLLRGGTVALHGGDVASQLVVDQGSKVSARQRLTVGTSSSPTAITIQNSSQLKSISSTLTVLSKRSDIKVASGSLLQAHYNLVLDAAGKAGSGDTTPGTISVSDAQLGAHAIRLHGFSPSGDALIIDNSNFKAQQFIELFAEGASTLRFRRRVTLQTDSALLAGQTVEVDPGGTVTISGKGRVYAKHFDYNQPGFGTITAKRGLAQEDLSKFRH